MAVDLFKLYITFPMQNIFPNHKKTPSYDNWILFITQAQNFCFTSQNYGKQNILLWSTLLSTEYYWRVLKRRIEVHYSIHNNLRMGPNMFQITLPFLEVYID